MPLKTKHSNYPNCCKFSRDKLSELQAAARTVYSDKYERTHHSVNIVENFDAFEGQNVRVAGRLMSKRGMGKVLFC